MTLERPAHGAIQEGKCLIDVRSRAELLRLGGHERRLSLQQLVFTNLEPHRIFICSSFSEQIVASAGFK